LAQAILAQEPFRFKTARTLIGLCRIAVCALMVASYSAPAKSWGRTHGKLLIGISVACLGRGGIFISLPEVYCVTGPASRQSCAALIPRSSGHVVPRSVGVATADIPLDTALSRILPFPTDAAHVCDDIIYEGPLETLRGKSEYLDAMRTWSRILPARLEAFSVIAVETWSPKPGLVQCRWSCRFMAPLPPTARFRGIPDSMLVLPDERVLVEIKLNAVLTLNDDGKVARHSEKFDDECGIPESIARYELLTARRRDCDDPFTWYWRVLRITTLEELAFRSGGTSSVSDNEWKFYEMVFRNFAYGVAIGFIIFTLLKYARGG